MRSHGSPDMLAAPLSPANSAEIERIEVIDNYALRPVWSDGHNSGIYPWVFLRQLCPCGGHGHESDDDDATH